MQLCNYKLGASMSNSRTAPIQKGDALKKCIFNTALVDGFNKVRSLTSGFDQIDLFYLYFNMAGQFFDRIRLNRFIHHFSIWGSDESVRLKEKGAN